MNWVELLKTLAPTVASAVMGPFGGIAVAGLGKLFGVDNATQKDVAKIFQDSQLKPEDVAKIQQLELEFKQHESEMGFKYADLEFKNVDSARNMQIATKSYFPATLSSGITVGFFGILLAMMFGNVTPSEPLLIMLGALGAAFGAVVNFWLGSNSNSARKTELLAQAQLPPK